MKSGVKADNIIRNLPFDGAYSTNTLGFAGGYLVTLEVRPCRCGRAICNGVGNPCFDSGKFFLSLAS